MSLDATPHSRRVARAAGLIMVLFVVSRVTGLLREMVIARQFGTSAELDAYLAAFRVPDLLFALMAGGALGSAFIPVFSDYLARNDEEGAWKLASAILNWVLLVLSVVGALVAALAPLLVSSVIAPGFSSAQQALTAELMRWMLIATVIFGVSGVVMGILNARQNFWQPALAPVVYNIAIMLGALVLGGALGVRGATVGVVFGAFGHLGLQLPGLRRAGMRFSLRLAPDDPGVREVGRLMAPRALGLAAVELNHLVNVMIASGLAAGSLAALNYGRLMMLLPEGVIAQSVAIAAFPTFSMLVAHRQRAELGRVLTTTLRSVVYLTLPAAVGLIWLAGPLVGAVLQRGAFDADSTFAVAWALLFYAVGLVSHAVVEVVTRAFYALHDTRSPVLAGAAATVANVGLSLELVAIFKAVEWPAHGGLALANSVATSAEMLILVYLIRKRLRGLGDAGLPAALWRMAAGALIMWAGLAGLTALLGDAPAWLVSLVGILVGGAIYGLVTLVLGSPEPVLLMRSLRSRVVARSPQVNV